jgi:hypothetical protein
MSEAMLVWMEIIFNVSYLVVIWGLVIAMIRRLSQIAPGDHSVGRLFIWAFGLLALGDTGHVGFRVVAYAVDGLETSIALFGTDLGLIGLGTLSTAVTVTGFYAVMAMVWKHRFAREYGWFEAFLFVCAGVRLVLMALPQNQWNQEIGPWPWSLYRNIPLILQGLGVVYLILRDAIPRRDWTFVWIAAMIIVSFAFYIPVILFSRFVPLIGMLMIPKTLAYVAIAVIGYRAIFLGLDKVYEFA